MCWASLPRAPQEAPQEHLKKRSGAPQKACCAYCLETRVLLSSSLRTSNAIFLKGGRLNAAQLRQTLQGVTFEAAVGEDHQERGGFNRRTDGMQRHATGCRLAAASPSQCCGCFQRSAYRQSIVEAVQLRPASSPGQNCIAPSPPPPASHASSGSSGSTSRPAATQECHMRHGRRGPLGPQRGPRIRACSHGMKRDSRQKHTSKCRWTQSYTQCLPMLRARTPVRMSEC